MKSLQLHLWIGIVWVMLSWAPLYGQQGLPLEQISIEQGLSQSFVNDVFEDHDGFLWFCTKYGLNRYDGYEFQVFRYDPYNPFSINDNTLVNTMQAGEMMVVLTEKGLNLFDRRKQRFYDLSSIMPAQGYSFSEVIAETPNSVIFFIPSADKHLLIRLLWPEDLTAQLERGVALKDVIRRDTLLSQHHLLAGEISADNHILWMLEDGQLITINPATGLKQESAAPHAGQWQFARMYSDGGQGFWLSAQGHLWHYNGRQWQEFQVPPQFFVLQVHHPTGILWASKGSHVYGFDLHQLPVSVTPDKAVHHLFIPEKALFAFTDHYHNVWFGTDARGLRKFNPKNSAFHNYAEGLSVYGPAITDNAGNIWIGEMRRAPFLSGIIQRDQQQLLSLESLGINLADGITRITKGEAGILWITGKDKTDGLLKLFRFDPQTRQKTTFPFPARVTTINRCLQYLAPGNIWMVNNTQLIRFDTRKQEWLVFDMPPDIAGSDVTAMEFAGGYCWIGTVNGLIRAIPQPDIGNDRFLVLKNNAADRNSISVNGIKSLLADPNDPDALWIGTNGGGLNHFNFKTQQFKHFTTADGLPDDVIYGVLPEDWEPGQPLTLWLSTNRGLCRFVPDKRYFQYYFKSDGLQDNEFNTYAYSKSDEGKMLFGGINGLTVFDPKTLKINNNPPNVKITGLKINGQVVRPGDDSKTLKTGVEFAPQVVLSYSRNNLLIQFAALDFTQPQRNQFEYYLEGMEAPWAHKGFEHAAQYLNLPPGAYTFYVKGSNSDGVWNDQPTSLRIVIHPPWYASWWAWLTYVVVLLFAAWQFYQYQLKRKLEHNETIRLKELDTFKSRFFTNVSHEFRTPLTVILGITEQLLHTAATQTRDKLLLVRRNGESLLRLVNQILDLAKLENNKLEINYIHSDILAYLRYVAESLHSLANTRNVMVRVESSAAKIEMDHDPERIQAIVHNLLSNAVKFTGSGGKVILKAEKGTWQNQSALCITVTDNGAGIAPDDLPFIFDRFFQARNQTSASATLSGKSGAGTGGTGIGLSLTKELVKAMNGDISVASEPGKGTVFTVWLPIRNEARAIPAIISPASNPAAPVSIPFTTQLPDADHLLIIEDNPDVLEYLVSSLSDRFRLDFAYNGRAGIEKALEIIPDLIISDVMMPEKDGYEVCDTLKNDERTSHIPIILLTAKAGLDSKLTGLKSGADAYLAKPFHPEELRITLDNLIQQRRKLQARYAAGQPPVLPAAREPQAEDVFLQKVRAAIESRIDDTGLTGEELCRMLGMSYPVVYRKLSALTGRSLNLFIRLVRLQKACDLLRNPQLTIAEVAYQTGFNDPKYFTRVFSEEYNTPPTAYRQNIDN